MRHEREGEAEARESDGSGRAEACTQRTYGARVRARGWSGQRDARHKQVAERT
jgi:hypothetical protein